MIYCRSLLWLYIFLFQYFLVFLFKFGYKSGSEMDNVVDFLLINALKDYRDGRLSGFELLKKLENKPEYHDVYANLCHLVADEDIREKDEIYRNKQIEQLNTLILVLQKNASLDELKEIHFL